MQRDDETEEAISNRLGVYNEKTAPLAGFYEKEGLLLTISATSSDDVINADWLAKILVYSKYRFNL